MKPMLAESIELTSVDRYINDPNWAGDQKVDGDRILIVVDDGTVVALNREGEVRRNAVPAEILAEFQALPGRWCFDGELVGGTLWLFDLPEANTHVTADHPYGFRRNVLGSFFAAWTTKPCIQLLPTAFTSDEKRDLYVRMQANHGEGVIFKHLDGRYQQGKRSRNVLKAKFVTTADVIVTAIGVDGKTNCNYSMVEDGRLVEVGSVSLHGKPIVKIGDIIEIRYLYASEDRRLYQPRMLRVRHDKGPGECTIDQLKFTNREIIKELT